jgi:hypothetical protein
VTLTTATLDRSNRYGLDGPGFEPLLEIGEFSSNPSSLLYNRYRVFFPGVKMPGYGTDSPPPCSSDVKETVELYLYSPSVPPKACCGVTFAFTYLFVTCLWKYILMQNKCIRRNWHAIFNSTQRRIHIVLRALTPFTSSLPVSNSSFRFHKSRCNLNTIRV